MRKLSLCVLPLLLCACGQSNPLLEQDANKTAQELVQASQKAALSSNLPADDYRRCINGKKTEDFCKPLYQSMSQTLHVKVKHLTDPRLIEKINPELHRLSWLMD